MGVRIVFKQLKFDNLYIDLDQGNCDLAMNGLEINAENVWPVLISAGPITSTSSTCCSRSRR